MFWPIQLEPSATIRRLCRPDSHNPASINPPRRPDCWISYIPNRRVRENGAIVEGHDLGGRYGNTDSVRRSRGGDRNLRVDCGAGSASDGTEHRLHGAPEEGEELKCAALGEVSGATLKGQFPDAAKIPYGRRTPRCKGHDWMAILDWPDHVQRGVRGNWIRGIYW